MRLPRLEPWQRNQYVLILTVAATFLGLDFSSPFLPLYILQLGVEDLGEAALWSGLMGGVAPLAAAVMGPVWGGMADRYGRKKMVLRALIAIAICTYWLSLVPNVQWAFVNRTVIGIMAGFTPMVLALAVSSGPRERVGQAVGMLQAAQFLPLALGPPVGGWISDNYGLRWNFALSGLVVALSALVLFFFFHEQPTSPESETRRASPQGLNRWSVLAVPGFAATMVVLFFTQFVDRSLPPILPIYLAALDTPRDQLATVSGLVTMAGAVSAAISAALYGRLARQGRTFWLLVIALVGGAITVAPLALAREWHQILAARALVGLTSGGVVALGYTLGARLAPADRAGLALGLLSSATLIGSAAAPLMAGMLGSFDLRMVFAFDCVGFLLALAVVLIWLRRVDRQEAAARPEPA